MMPGFTAETKRDLAWIALCFSAGPILLFGIMVIYLWGAGASGESIGCLSAPLGVNLIVTGWSIHYLLAYYRSKQCEKSIRWQFSLGDLIVMIVVFGMAMTGGHACNPQIAISVGIIALVLGISFGVALVYIRQRYPQDSVILHWIFALVYVLVGWAFLVVTTAVQAYLWVILWLLINSALGFPVELP